MKGKINKKYLSVLFIIWNTDQLLIFLSDYFKLKNNFYNSK